MLHLRAPSRLPALLLAMTVTACTGGETPEDQPAPLTPKVLVIGIDGVRPDVLAEVPTPNLDALIADGTYTDQAQTGLPSVSGPGWSSFLNGVWSEKHGVTNNDFTGKMGAPAIKDLLSEIELDELADDLRATIKIETSVQRKKESLKRLQGKSIVNSINLEDGEEKFVEVLKPLAMNITLPLFPVFSRMALPSTSPIPPSCT